MNWKPYKNYLRALLGVVVLGIVAVCYQLTQEPDLDFSKLDWELGLYVGDYHVTSNKVEVKGKIGQEYVELPASESNFYLYFHDGFMVIRVTMETEKDSLELYRLYPLRTNGGLNEMFTHQETEYYELTKMGDRIKCRIKENKSKLRRSFRLKLQVGLDYFPFLTIYQEGRK